MEIISLGFQMPRTYAPRKYFTTYEIQLIRNLASQGKSQSHVSKLLNRQPGVIAQAAKRYNIQFTGKPGRPKTLSPELLHLKKITYVRNFRRRKRNLPQIPLIFRYDDPRILISGD